MKNFLLFVLVAGLTITGCKKDKAEASATQGTFTVSNTNYTFKSVYWFTGGTTTPYFDLMSMDVSDNELYVRFANKAVGDITCDDLNYVVLTVGNDYYESVNTKVTIKITKADATTITGTFSGKFTKNYLTAEVDASGTFSASKSPIN